MSYDLYWREISTPTPEARRHDRPGDADQLEGFWRLEASPTKVDWPVAIWTSEGGTFWQVGQMVRNTAEHASQWEDFAHNAFLRCVAVPEDVYRAAVDSGLWPDGKEARKFTPEERADIIPAATDSEGRGTNVPVDEETGEPVDTFHQQIAEKITAQLEKVGKLGAITSLEIANKAAEIIEALRTLGKLGEAKRKEEIEPHRLAAQAVQDKWLPYLQPASATIESITAAIQKFRKREEERVRREQEAQREAERQRLAEEAAENLRQQAAEEAKQAQRLGLESTSPTEQEIVEQAEEIAAEAVATMPAPAPKIRVGKKFGKAVPNRKTKRGRITDQAAFIAAISEHPDFVEWLEDKANKLARANAVVDGMEIVNE